MKRTSQDPPGEGPGGWSALLIAAAVVGSSLVTLLLLWVFGLLGPMSSS